MGRGRERERGKKDKQQQLGFTEFPTEQRGARSIVKRLLSKSVAIAIIIRNRIQFNYSECKRKQVSGGRNRRLGGYLLTMV